MVLADINWKPSPHQLRQFGWAGSVLLAMVAAWLYYHCGGILAAMPILLGAMGMGSVAFWRPRFLRPLYVFFQIVSFPSAWLGSHLTLVVIYFGLFSSVALIFRLLGRDALQRRFDPQATSYWQVKRTTGGLRQYLKQF